MKKKEITLLAGIKMQENIMLVKLVLPHIMQVVHLQRILKIGSFMIHNEKQDETFIFKVQNT